MHLSAQVQGALYSLRILGQILRYAFSDDEKTMPSGVKLTYGVCKALPGLEEMMVSDEETADEVVKFDAEDTTDRLMMMLQTGTATGISAMVMSEEEEERKVSGPTGKGKRGGRKQKPQVKGKTQQSGNSRNMYNLLAQDD